MHTELYRQIGLACAKDEALVDYLSCSAEVVGKNNIFQAFARSYTETDGDGTKVWHSLNLVDRVEPAKYHSCKISEDGETFYSDSQDSHGMREMSLKDWRDITTVLLMLKELEQVEWQSGAQIQSEGRLPRFNL